MADRLLDHLVRRIRREGPLTVAAYMAACLGHPTLGYYTRRDPFGRAGDFVTAPEVSQMFGELVGLWAAAAWQAAGSPVPAALVELGPGRGTLMADMLRAARLVPAFAAALSVHLVETSPALRAVQARTVGRDDATWHDDLSTLPDCPWLLVANEFLDALPVHQLELTPAGWCERLVGTDATGRLAWALDPRHAPLAALLPRDWAASAMPGAIAEVSPQVLGVGATIGRHLAAHGGAALLVDYGDAPPSWPTLQAVRRHRRAEVLETPGEADLTAHVDFAAVARAAREAGADSHGPVTQRALLLALGIEARAARLAAARPDGAEGVARDLERLIGPDGMGTLFKALAIVPAGAPVPAGFEIGFETGAAAGGATGAGESP
jgi:NADH dehydrogenase [ubiquinone] 1 alpha subcomplex assembly factor 7